MKSLSLAADMDMYGPGELNFAECFLSIMGCRCHCCIISFVDSTFEEETSLLFYCRRIFVEFDKKTAEVMFFLSNSTKILLQ